MRKRYLCPKHAEKTGSAVVYNDSYFCFGCGARGPVAELGLPAGERIEVTYVEDIKDSMERIRRLPLVSVRGLTLHSNDRGYYICWHDDTYYKYRSNTDSTAGGKYRGPSGHRKPWYLANEGNGTVMVLVEGELNAMSLALVTDASVMSPGGSGDFYSKTAEKYLQQVFQYETVFVVTDDDAAGAQAAIEATAKLKSLGHKDVRIKLVKEDFNQILCERGEKGLREAARSLGLPTRV